MTSIQTKLSPLADMLVEQCSNTYHYWRSAPKGVKAYIVWAEDQEADSLNGNNLKLEQGIHGTIDYFTKTEFDEVVDNIQDGLNGLENVSWRINSVQYEEETMFIHHEWEFWVR